MKRSLSFLMLVVITGAACAQWPVELSLPGGMPAHYPIMCADGQDGAVVACAGLAYGYDVWLFRVSSTGQVLWSGNGAPPVRLRLPRSQKPVQLALADSCFVVLIEDWNYAPPSHRQLLVWCVDEQGDSLWCQVVRDSLRSGDVGSLYSLTIINSTDVLACWGDHRLDSAGTWYRSLDLTTGTTRGGGSYPRLHTTPSAAVRQS